MKLKLYLLKLYFYKPRVLIRVLNIQYEQTPYHLVVDVWSCYED